MADSVGDFWHVQKQGAKMNITGIWEGTLDGTNWGRLLVKLTEENGNVTGYAEITDIGIGTYNLLVTGLRVSEMVGFHLAPSNSGVRAYPGTIDVRLTSETENLIRGEWKSSIGTYGTFRANKQTEPAPSIEVIGRKIAESNAAFIIMAFGDQAPNFLPVVDIQSSIKRGCEAAGVSAHRVDELEHSGPITNLILDQIKSHRFLISDLTHERQNVYYEVGYAHGMQKEVILTAQIGTTIHFDIANYNVIFYKSGTELEGRVAKRLHARLNNAEQLN
jgi:hypothetical protein